MARLLILVALLWLGWLLYRRWMRMSRARTLAEKDRATGGGDMVRCARCHLHLPAGDALKAPPTDDPSEASKRFFCCQSHRTLFEQEGALPRRSDSGR